MPFYTACWTLEQKKTKTNYNQPWDDSGMSVSYMTLEGHNLSILKIPISKSAHWV